LFLHTGTSDFLDGTAPAATTAKFKDSAALNRTTFREIGTWSASLTSATQLDALSALRAWIGLKNSDDQGTFFDLRAELLKNGAVIASGETKNIQNVTRNPNKAKEVTVSFGAISSYQFSSADVLSIRILTKVADSGGHNNAVGLRLYYDAVSRPSRFGAVFAPPTSTLQVTITSPTPGAVINRSSVLVIGEIVGATGTEIGVAVNGALGLVSNGQFAARVPVDSTVTELTATAKDAAGNTGIETIPVTIQSPPAETVSLTVSPASGVAPLQVSFRATFLGPVANYQWDTDGNGVIDFSGSDLSQVAQEYLNFGLYFPSVVVTDNTGAQFTETVPVLAFSQAATLALLHSKWQGLKDALRAGNVNGALNFIAEESRNRYSGIFNALGPNLSQVDSILTNIQLGAIRDKEVEFAMLRVSADGVERSFHVLFVRDNDGIWRLRTF
jgi:hypothetical protein